MEVEHLLVYQCLGLNVSINIVYGGGESRACNK